MNAMVKALLLSCLWVLSAHAQDPRFCADRADASFGQQFLHHADHQLSFRNSGGILNGGVCWWHSRFTRNAAFVARFRPDLPKPALAAARRLVSAIRAATALVDVPGYSDLETFSVDFAGDIQRELNRWQLDEGVGQGDWRRGLSGRSSVAPEVLARGMDELHALVSKGKVVYQKLQFPGITAHAWLVLGMEKTADGYTLTVHDSNYHGVRTHVYTRGMRHMPYGNTRFVPYTERMEELSRFETIIRAECAH